MLSLDWNDFTHSIFHRSRTRFFQGVVHDVTAKAINRTMGRERFEKTKTEISLINSMKEKEGFMEDYVMFRKGELGRDPERGSLLEDNKKTTGFESGLVA